MIKLPEALGRGAVVRVIAPSGAFDRTAFDLGVRLLTEAGWRPVYDEEIFERHHYFAGTDARRLRELERALADRDARCVWMARGGYGATRLLRQLDPGAVSGDPKWLVGFSDATALHALWARAGVASVHGANVTTLGQWSEEHRRELFALLGGERPAAFVGETLQAGPSVRGRLLGGNLTVLAAMAGTGQLPAAEGGIVLVEDIGERPYRLDRSLTQLVQSGAFVGAAGFVIGQLTDCVEASGRPDSGYSAREAVVDVLAPLGRPILGGLPIGHEPTARALVLGVEWILDTACATLTVA